MEQRKISIIGAGNIGGTLAHLIGIKNLGDVVLVDVNNGLPQGKSLDLSQSYIIEGLNGKVYGTTQYDQIKNSDVIVVTAGITRSPGMTRDDLLKTNLSIIKEVAKNINEHSPNSFIIVITNPLDAMVWAMYKYLNISSKMIVGMAGTLDSARFSYFLSRELNVSVEDVSSLVLGGHGDLMLPLLRYSTVSGIPIKDLIEMGWITQDKIEEIITKTRKGGEEIVSLLKNGSAYYAPASSTACIIDSYLNNKRSILPCASYLNGNYGIEDLFIGVPVIIGKNGVEKVIEVKFTQEEKEIFDSSVEKVTNIISSIKL